MSEPLRRYLRLRHISHMANGRQDDLALVIACFDLLPDHPGHFLQILKPLAISESETHHHVQRDELDDMLAHGWRTHGHTFFRYNLWDHGGRWHWILPLRLEIDRFHPGKSQRRVLKANQDVTVKWQRPKIDPEHEELFLRHAARFQENAPGSLLDYLAPGDSDRPCVCRELEVRLNGRLIASSYIHAGLNAHSSIYAMFDPDEHARGLGIFTMLQEIENARRQGAEWWYPGYATLHQGIYDYKKNFEGLQYFDWRHSWNPFPKGGLGLAPPPAMKDWKNFP